MERSTRRLDFAEGKSRKRILGALLAHSMGVFTPEVKLEKVRLMHKGKTFTTHMAKRDWLSENTHENFETVYQLSIRCASPLLCHRLDWMYIVLCDLILANWNRVATNFLFNSKIGTVGTLVAIDWETCFDYDRLPTTVEGIKKFFSPFLLDPHLTGFLSIPVPILEKTWIYIKNNINYELLKAVDTNLIHRVIHLEKPLRDFLKEFSIGLFQQERLSNAAS